MTNIYIYDQELSGRKYQKLLERLETRLTDLGIGGKIYRLAPLTRLEAVMKDELVKKPKTLIAVGGDALISRLAGLTAGTNIPLGIIPVGSSMIADGFGITTENACRTLAARRIVTLDIGRVNGQHFFVCRAVISANNPGLILDGELNVEAEGKVLIEAVNITGDEYGYRGTQPQGDDGRLNVYILKTEKSLLRKEISQSAFICKQLEITKGATAAQLDGATEINLPKSIEVVPGLLTVIVGKDRTF